MGKVVRKKINRSNSSLTLYEEDEIIHTETNNGCQPLYVWVLRGGRESDEEEEEDDEPSITFSRREKNTVSRNDIATQEELEGR